MIFVYKDRKIHVEWTVFKGKSFVHEDFTRALIKVFIAGVGERYLLPAKECRGTLFVDVPEGIPEGVYSLELIYVKNMGNLKDCRFNDRCFMRSRVDSAFAITEYQQEATEPDEDEITLRYKSQVASYGYDGLSAYEIAVLRGDWNGTEGEWLKWIHQNILDNVSHLINNVYLEWEGSAYLTRISMPKEMRRKGIIITYEMPDGEIHTEKNVNDESTDNEHWGLDSSWVRIDELSLSGDIAVSPDGTWVINGIDTGINAVGPQGKPGATITPRINLENDTVEYSWDKVTWHEMFSLSSIRPTIEVVPGPEILSPGANPTVRNEGNAFNVKLKFGLPASPKIDVTEVQKLNAGSDPTVQNTGTVYDAKLKFGLPASPTVNIGEVDTLFENQLATVTNSGTPYSVVLNFGIPRGYTGAKGDKGDGWQAKGFVDSSTNLPDSDNAMGDTYMVGTTTPYSVYMWNGIGWVNVGSATEIKSGVFDGGRADSQYGGARTIDCGRADV